MITKEITIERFKKLKPCIVKNGQTGIWNKTTFNLVRRNKRRTTVAFLFHDNVLTNSYKNDDVKLITSEN